MEETNACLNRFVMSVDKAADSNPSSLSQTFLKRLKKVTPLSFCGLLIPLDGLYDRLRVKDSGVLECQFVVLEGRGWTASYLLRRTT